MAKNTSLGLDEKLEGALAYLLGFITGLAFLLAEKKSKSVRFHALQSIVVSVAAYAIFWVLGIFPLIGGILTSIWGLGCLILWIYCMFKAYQGKTFELPIVGPFVKKQKF
ncbi:MAG: DUF4870 domain-containing protein [archaeon]